MANDSANDVQAALERAFHAGVSSSMAHAALETGGPEAVHELAAAAEACQTVPEAIPLPTPPLAVPVAKDAMPVAKLKLGRAKDDNAAAPKAAE